MLLSYFNVFYYNLQDVQKTGISKKRFEVCAKMLHTCWHVPEHVTGILVLTEWTRLVSSGAAFYANEGGNLSDNIFHDKHRVR